MATYSPLIAAILSVVMAFCADFTSTRYSRAEFEPRMDDFTIPSGEPSGANLLFFCISMGISSLRKASICHWGDPYQTESLRHMTWSGPSPRTSVPMSAAASCGFDTAQGAEDVPTSP